MRLYAVALATLLAASGYLTAHESGHDSTENTETLRPVNREMFSGWLPTSRTRG